MLCSFESVYLGRVGLSQKIVKNGNLKHPKCSVKVGKVEDPN